MSAFIWPIRVYYEDTDSGGIVYHANYLKFMERGRTEWLRALGFDQSRLTRELGIIFVVRSLEIEYYKPALYDDRLEIATHIVASRGASLRFHQAVRRSEPTPELLADGDVKVACLDAQTLKPRPIPDAIRTEIVDVG